MALVRKALLQAKAEVTYGVDPTPAAGTNDILIYDPRISADGLVLTRPTLDASLSRRPHVIGRKLVTIEFSTELKGSGVIDTPPEIGVLLRACQMAETITPATRVRYAFESSGFESVTIYFYNDELIHKITGAYGTWDLAAAAGEFGRINWRFQGLWNDVTTAAIPGGTVFQSTKPPMIQSAALTVGGYVGKIQNFTLNANIGLDESRDLNSAEGLAKIATLSREVTGTLNPLVVPVATYDPWGLWKAGMEGAMTATFGATVGNRVAIQSAPKLQYTSVGYGERAGERTFELGFALNRSAATGDDELVLDFS
jgi:hypothetical protein